MAKTIIVAVLALAIGVGIGFEVFHQSQSFGSPAGSTFSTEKVAAQSVQVSTTTTFSILNTDASDRFLSGRALISLWGGTSTTTDYAINCATSTSASSLVGNTHYVLGLDIVAASSAFGTTTGTTGLLIATSSAGVFGTTTASTLPTASTTQYIHRWPANTYLDCQVTTGDAFNAFNAAVQGIISFGYNAS